MAKDLKLVIKIREKEVLRYLKYDLAKTKADSNIYKLVQAQIQTGTLLVNPAVKYKTLPIISNDGQKVTLKNIIIENKNIARLLKNAHKIVIFACTIGGALEKEIARLFAAAEPTKAVILDAVGSEAVEVLIDRVQEAVTGKAGSYLATPRFSPGYGDCPLSINKMILQLLEAHTIGVKVSSKFMLIPQKTVTGIWGLVKTANSVQVTGEAIKSCDHFKGRKVTFKNLFKKNKLIIFDGAMGTMLQRENLPQGVCPETYNLTHPQIIKKIHQAYINAGAQVIIANTFGANRLKLKSYGLAEDQEKLIYAGVKLAKEAAKSADIIVAGDISILGELLEPLGKVSFGEALDIYAEQAWLLKNAGCDCLVIETMTDLQEMRAAIIGSKKTGLPVIASMTFEKELRTVTGTDPRTAAIVMQSLGADVIGANCSAGPRELLAVAREMAVVADVPVIIQPNAGLPRLEDGKTVFPLGAEEFASFAADFAKVGVSCLGGCCGTTPEHIKQLSVASRRSLVSAKKIGGPAKNAGKKTYLASRTKTVEVGEYPVIIGERINPTARKALAEAIKAKNFSLVLDEARVQVSAGCDLLDVNVSVPGTNEKESIRRLVLELSSQIDKPLVLDSPNPEVIEEGLKQFPGKALVNSVTGEKAKLKRLLPLVKQYGAAVIGLCIDEKGIPKTWQKRVEIAGKIIKEADFCGIPRSDVFIDCLTLAISAEPGKTLDTVRAITEIKRKYGVKTVLGISNVSHGLPNRSLVNANFLGIAVAAGLDAVIMNPLDEKMQETLLAAAYISGKDANGQKYLAKFGGANAVASRQSLVTSLKVNDLKNSIITGNKDAVLGLTEEKLAAIKPLDIINQEIIPALEEVGRKYESKEYFLPQLMIAAECAQVAMKRLQKELVKDTSARAQKQATIIFATVKDDVHDIGKNIVIAILQNYGYNIIDLGKDVAQGKIVAAAKKHKAKVVALSALMTTTMVEMPLIITALKQAGLKVKTVIGGAVVTGDYAASIGADAYAKDAVEAARVIKNLVGR